MIILVASEYREADELKDWAANSWNEFFLADSLRRAVRSLQFEIPSITVLEAIFHAAMNRYGLETLSVTEQANNSPYFSGDE